MSPTLRAEAHNHEPNVVYCIQGNCIDRADTAGCNGAGWTEGRSYTLNTIDRPAVAFASLFQPKSAMDENWEESDKKNSLRAEESKSSHVVVHTAVFDARGNGDGSICPTITGDHENRITDYTGVVTRAFTQIEKYLFWIVRRLTPLECERLQGFPDGWTDIGDWVDSKGKVHKGADSPRYKALGNSIALPSWYYVMLRLSLACGVQNTMASLFDGIGGFPLLWETINGKGTCIWASEIEEFPIAVTKKRFQ